MTKMAKKTVVRKQAEMINVAKVLPLMTEQEQRGHEYNVLCNERSAGPIEAIPMLGVVGQALGHPYERDVMQGMLSEIETRTKVLALLFAGEQDDPGHLHGNRELLESEMLMLNEKVRVVRELLRRNANGWQSPGGVR